MAPAKSVPVPRMRKAKGLRKPGIIAVMSRRRVSFPRQKTNRAAEPFPTAASGAPRCEMCRVAHRKIAGAGSTRLVEARPDQAQRGGRQKQGRGQNEQPLEESHGKRFGRAGVTVQIASAEYFL